MATKKKTSDKTNEKKILTPKQAQIKVGSLFKGLDNEVAKLQTGMKTITGLKSQISSLALGLANVAVSATAAAKAAKTAKPAPVKAVKAEAKPAKAAKKAANIKPAKAAKPAKATKKAEAKPAKAAKKAEAKPTKAASIEKAPVPNRPTTRDAIKEILTEAGEFLPVVEARDRIVAKYGYISRQSVYQAAKKDKDVVVIDGKLGLAGFTKPTETTEATEDDNAEEALVTKIAQSQSTSAMA